MRMGSAQGNGLEQSDDYYQESKMQLSFFSYCCLPYTQLHRRLWAFMAYMREKYVSLTRDINYAVCSVGF